MTNEERDILLIRLDERVKTLFIKIDALMEQEDEERKESNKRLIKLEKNIYYFAGAIAAVVFVIETFLHTK